MNLKRKRQGYGYYQWSEQSTSEEPILHYLSDLSNKVKITKDGKDLLHPWGSIRDTARRTGLHHTTVRKAVERMKEAKYIIEVPGTRNARLFTLIDTDNADYIRKECKRDPRYRKMLEKINSKDVLKEFKKKQLIWYCSIYSKLHLIQTVNK